MALVDYSDSDDSDTERNEPTPAAKAPVSSSKPTFQKVTDRSNPGKIRVSLPQPNTKETQTDEPPAKRAKIGGGGLGGFNSFLPAPKRTGVKGPEGLTGNGSRKGGLGPGVSLKTGAEPGFSRELDSVPERAVDEEEYHTALSGNGRSLPTSENLAEVPQKPAEEVKLVGKPLMFKPLSVARKPVKKKKAADITTQIPKPSSPEDLLSQVKIDQATERPAAPLFSVSSEDNYSMVTPSNGEYRPMVYGAMSTDDPETSGNLEKPLNEEQLEAAPRTIPPSDRALFGTESLNNIASDLNLSAAERRQLFGRQKGAVASATKIINFNTDDEYRHNEELRASGEQVAHNAVRAIAPGKHSLKQLVNAVGSQKEALEESFAAGRSNRKEAGSKYGW